MTLLHLSKVLLLMRRAQENNTPFDIEFIKRSTGEIVSAKQVIQTSSNFNRRTRNIRFQDSAEIRTIRNILIIKFNNVEVYV